MEGAPFSSGGAGQSPSRFESPAGGGGLGVAGILEAAFAVYRQQAVSLWTIVLLIVIPVQVLEWVLVRVSLSHPNAHNGTVYSNFLMLVPALAVAVLGFASGGLAPQGTIVPSYTGSLKGTGPWATSDYQATLAAFAAAMAKIIQNAQSSAAGASAGGPGGGAPAANAALARSMMPAWAAAITSSRIATQLRPKRESLMR